jgi:hypothetical protein
VRKQASKRGQEGARTEIERAPARVGERAGERERVSERARKGGEGGVVERERKMCKSHARGFETLS